MPGSELRKRRARGDQFILKGNELKQILDAKGRSYSDIFSILGRASERALSVAISGNRAQSREEVEKLANFLECEVKTIATPRASFAERAHNDDAIVGKTFLVSKDINKLYLNFGAGNFVAILSVDGFLEAGDDGFFEYIKDAIKRGLEIYYLVPQLNSSRASVVEYNNLLRSKFKNHLSDIEQKRVHCHYLDPDFDLIGSSSRIVIFGKKNGHEVETENIYIYVSSGHQYWVKLHEDERHTFLTKLEASIDPVPYNPPSLSDNEWRMPYLVKKRYQTSFTGGEFGYGPVREILNTRVTAERVAEIAQKHFADRNFDWEKNALRWLDVGCEDGTNTEVIYDVLSSNKEHQVALTAIDSSAHQYPNDLLRKSVYWAGSRGTLEDYLDKHPISERFDLITLLHSSYVIDPLSVIEAYRRLTTDGLLILVTSPFAMGETPSQREETNGNFINIITGLADNHIEGIGRAGVRQRAYENKVIVADPWRAYGEDWVRTFETFFGTVSECWDFELRPNNDVGASRILTDEALTVDGEAIAKFFAHGRVDDLDAYLADVFSALQAMARDDRLPADEFILQVSKRYLKANYSRPPRFRPEPPPNAQPSMESPRKVAKPAKPLIVFASTGGTCRDPMAKAIFERYCGDSVEVRAASIYLEQRPISDGARTIVAKELGVDLSGYVSSPLDDALVEAASLILVMENSHRDDILRYDTRRKYRSKVRLVTDFEQDLGFNYIENPWCEDGAPEKDTLQRYQRSYDQLHEALYHGRGAILATAQSMFDALA